MKKLLVLALAVVLTLSLAVVASAATFDPYVGGEFQIVYAPDAYADGQPLGNIEGDSNGARFKSYVTGTVKDADTNTWAKIGCLIKTWDVKKTVESDDINANKDVSFNAADPIFEAGIDKIAGILSIWYTNDEDNDCDRGQVPLNQAFYKFGGDPVFDKGPGNVFSFKVTTDNVNAALIYGPNKSAADENLMIVAGTFKFDGGNVWLAYEDKDDSTTQTAAGMEYKFGFGTLKVDYSVWGGDSLDDVSTIQAAIDMMDSKLNLTLLVDDKHLFATDGGMGFGATYNFTDKMYVGVRSISPTDSADKNDTDNQTVAYLGIKYGVFDTRLGTATVADGDSVFFATTHVGMW